MKEKNAEGAAIGFNGRVLLAFALLLILGYGMAGFFAFPVADDLSFALMRKEGGWWELGLNEWNRWSGRYISNFLVLASPLYVGGIDLYTWMPLLLLLFLLFSVYTIYRLARVEQWPVFVGGFLLVFLGGMPDVTEGIFWFTGAWIYFPGVFIFTLAFTLKLSADSDENGPRKRKLILSAILFFLAGGFNELMAIWALFFSVFLFQFKKARWEQVLLLVFHGLNLLWVFSAPGNQIRQAQFEGNHQVFNSFVLSSLYTGRFMIEWVLNPTLWIWALFLVFYSGNNKASTQPHFAKPLKAVFLSLGALYLSVFTPVWATGILGQYRTINQAYFLFLILFSMAVYHNRFRLRGCVPFGIRFKSACFLFLVFGMVWKNNYFLWKELCDGQLHQFHIEMLHRFSLLEQCNSKECWIPELSVRPKTLFVYPLSEDPNHWKNRQYQEYFSTEAVHKIEN
jgi:hypothetical protein